MVVLLCSIVYVLLFLCFYLFKNEKAKKCFRYILPVPVVVSFFSLQLYSEFHWYSFLAAFPIAYLTYVISGLIVNSPVTKNAFIPAIPRHLSSKLQETYHRHLLKNCYSSIFEELIYRGMLYHCILQLSGNHIVAVALIILFFSGVHYLAPMAVIQKIDILVFSVIITVLYAVFQDVYMACVIHLLRNMLIIFGQFKRKNEKQKRMRELLQSYRRNVFEMDSNK